MRIVVIGGSGFLGSHVSDQLALLGHEVTVFDRQKSKWIGAGKKMVVGDIRNIENLIDVTRGAEIIYNFAGIADLNAARKKPLETVELNILGNLNVLEACRINKVNRYIYASTVYVYSKEGGFYRCSKQAAENYIEEFQKIYGLDYTILRYGSLYGPRADDSNGLLNIVKSAIKNGFMSYGGDPLTRREYIHVGDAARASVEILSDEYKNQSILLTGQEAIHMDDLLKMIAEILGISQEIKYTQATTQGHYTKTPYTYKPKIGRRYVPKTYIDLGEGLLELIEDSHNH